MSEMIMRKNKQTLLSRIFLVCALLLVLCSGCYNELGRQLFYRLDYYKFKVVDIDNKPVPHAEMTFYYKKNLDISGKHERNYWEKLRTNENGEVIRFGWVRNTPYLTRITAKGFYANYRDFRIEKRENVITLFPKRNPIALLTGTVRFRLEEKYHGKMYFRFSDLELSIPCSPEYRLAYQWDDEKKTVLGKRKHNTDFRPDLIFDFQQGILVAAEFASANIPDLPQHRSKFSGIYEAPSTGYEKVKLTLDRLEPCFLKPIVFRFPYQDKICYGLIRRIASYPSFRVVFDYQLNLTGSRNLEGDDNTKLQPQNEAGKLLLQQKNSLWPDRYIPLKITSCSQ